MEIRDLDPDDLDQALDIRNRSFRPLAESRWDSWRQMMGRALADRRVLGCYDGARLVGTTRINRYRQWWQGQSLPMAGISGVVVAPEYRGRGVARQLMQATLERAAGLGYPISVLYPATVSLYRDRGWEIGGAQHLVTLPTAALRRLIAQPVPLRRAGPDDAGEVLSVVRQVHAATRVCGPYLQEEIEVRNRIENDQPFTYLAEDGFLAYRWDGGDLVVDEIVAGSGETARTLWSVVGSGSSTAATVRASVGPTDPLYWLVGEAVVQPPRSTDGCCGWWMYRRRFPGAATPSGWRPRWCWTWSTSTGRRTPGPGGCAWRAAPARSSGTRLPARPPRGWGHAAWRRCSLVCR